MASLLLTLYRQKHQTPQTELKKEDAMRTMLRAILVTLASVAPALAATGSEAKGSVFLLILFLGFAALIVVFQFIPGILLFASMLKGLFSRAPHKATDALPVKPGS